MVVADAEDVRGDHAGAQDVFTRCDVVRVDVGQGLKDRERDHQFADATGVLALMAVPLRVSRVFEIRQIEQCHSIAVGVRPDEFRQPRGQLRVWGWEFHFAMFEEAEIHHRERQEFARGTFFAGGFADLDQPLGLQSADPSILVAIEWIGARRNRPTRCD